MTYHELAGFLFAVCCCPEPVRPSEWLPLIFDEKEAVYQDMEEASEVMGAIMSLHNRTNQEVMDRQPRLPPGFVKHDEPAANFQPGAHLSQWAKGFVAGHSWLEEIWSDYAFAEFDEELGAVLFILVFFADRELTRRMHEEMCSPNTTLEKMAATALSMFEDSMQSYAHLGRSINEALMEIEYSADPPEAARKPGRNDPCPCGSGQKYKKCCEGKPPSVKTRTDKIYQLKITLKGSKPPIWRRVQAPDTTLDRISDYLLTAMGWMGGHLHGFHARNRYYGVPDPDWGDPDMIDESSVFLSNIVSTRNKKFSYDYDFGDGWEHEVLLEKVLKPEPGTSYPVCLTGRRACPPEDVGGIHGFYEFLEAVEDPAHPEHEAMLEWAGGAFDAAKFDVKETNEALDEVARGGGWWEDFQ